MNKVTTIASLVGFILTSIVPFQTLAVDAGQGTAAASVEVANTIRIDKNDDLSFGKIYAKADTTSSGSFATLTIPADGSDAEAPSITGTVAGMAIITPGQRASFTISDAAVSTDLSITFGDDYSVDLSHVDDAVSNAKFIVNSFKAADEIGTDLESGKLTTDETGQATFYVGASLVTETGSDEVSKSYGDGTYSGNFNVSVNY